MLRDHRYYLVAWRVFNDVLLIGGFLLPWSGTYPGWAWFLRTIDLPSFLIGDPVAAILMISAWLTVGYLVANFIAITARPRAFGWLVVIVLLCATMGLLLPVFTAEATVRIGIGYYFLMFGLVSSSYLETIVQVSD